MTADQPKTYDDWAEKYFGQDEGYYGQPEAAQSAWNAAIEAAAQIFDHRAEILGKPCSNEQMENAADIRKLKTGTGQ